MKKRISIIRLLIIFCLLGIVFSVIALTVARPLTAKVYHYLCNTYTEFITAAEVEKLYQYKPQSAETIDVTDLRLPEVPPLTEEEEELWTKTVALALKEDLWTERDMYDAAHYLMVPMHYAFYTRDSSKISTFHDFFARFIEDVSDKDSYGFCVERPTVNHLQFCYFVSEYLRLCAIFGFAAETLPDLYEFVYQHTVNMFESGKDGWTNLGSFRARIEQILLHTQFPRSFDSALTDVELYLLATLCDLRVVAKLQKFEDTAILQDATMLAYKIFTDASIITETEKGGFLFQVGVMKDYPGYEYAGNLEITPDIQPKPREDIVSDSSHSARFALWLTSFQQAQDYQEQYDLFQLRREQLANQLVNYVIVYENGIPLATTFMDGTCGVYRYSYNSEGVGHQGYSLSGTLLLGWWSFLDDPRITQVYRDILVQFPMSAGMDNPYFDYATTREQNPFFDMDTAFDNGMMECMVALASKFGTT